MTVTISRGALEPLIVAAKGRFEVCGLLRGRAGAILRVEPARNVAADPEIAFEIDPTALFAALRDARGGGFELMGHYHSHPVGPPVPSPRDAAGAAADGALWLLLGEGQARLWRAVPNGVVAGLFDPVALSVIA